MTQDQEVGRVPQAEPGSREPSPSVSAASGFDPSRDALEEIIGHLGAAVTQSLPTDDQIIMEHVRAALEWARPLSGAATLYRAGGTRWRCRSCEQMVVVVDGGPRCGCETSPSPWEPVP